jgi:ABC-type transport system involved in cytochrome c biogenesis ATPase subunit
MDSSTEVARRFEDILKRCGSTGRPDGLPHAQRVVYYIVAVRCEMDMNGFDSVLDQLLTEDELHFVCASLEELNEESLAATWWKIASFLKSVGLKPSGSSPIRSLPQAVQQELDVLAKTANAGNRLWHLDEKLAALWRSPLT